MQITFTRSQSRFLLMPPIPLFSTAKLFCTLLLMLLLMSIATTELLGQTDPRPTQGVSLGYFNDKFGSHGMRVGYETAPWQAFRNESDPVSIRHALVAKVSLSFYNHKRHHTALLANVTFGYRYTSKWGLVVEPLHVGGGYLHSLLGGKTYQLDENGDLQQVKLAGTATAILPYIQLLGLGYDFRQRSNLPLSFFVSLDPYVQRSVNGQPRLRLATPISLTYFYK